MISAFAQRTWGTNSMSDAVLSVERLEAGYGDAQVLFGVDLTIRRGEVVALMGRNGMGKTTLIRAIMGLCTRLRGRVAIASADATRWPSYRIARAGIGLVPEGRQIFTSLTVEENLLATERSSQGASGWSLDGVYQLFPRLQERQANFGSQLSGGEQQMLAIGRALLTQPSLLILDEATEGLAPLVRQEIWNTLHTLKSRGQSVLVVDRDLKALGALSDGYLVIEKGRVVKSGSSSDLVNDRQAIERYVGV